MKLKRIFLISVLFSSITYSQTANNCGNYTSSGSNSSPYLPGSNTACNSAVPGTVNTTGAWTGSGCSGNIVSTVVGPPVSCLTVSYTAVNTDDYGTLSTNTGGVLTITGVNVGVSGNVIGPYQCVGGGGGYGDVMVTICSTIPFNSLTLLNTGCSSGWVVNCATPVTCNMTNLTANVGACVPGPNTYSTTGQVQFSGAPATGQLIVEDCNGVQQVFNPPFTSPINYSLTGQNANNAPCDITAYFTAAPSCTMTVNYTAPTCVCNIDNFTANISACQAGSVYDINGTVTYSSPPPAGSLVIQVDNGTSTYSTTINPPFTSPDNYTITGIPANSANSTITAFFTSNPACTSTINFTATAPCNCDAEVGTFTPVITGSSTNNYVLCYGDEIDITSNNDWVGPGEMFAPPGPVYDPGVSWLVYSCAPTVALTPDPMNTVPSDPCFIGLVSDFDLYDINDMYWINSYPPGTFTNNTVYFVPITMYSITSGTYSYVNTSLPCYEMGPAYAVQYLPEFNYAITQDCPTSSATVTVSGGLPALNGSNFTASNLLPATASFGNTTCANNGTIVVNGLNSGENYSFTITDGNGCPYQVTGGPFLLDPVINAGPDQTICLGANVTLTGSGAGVGGTYTWDNGVTNNVAFSPAATTTYTVTGTNSQGCSNTDQVTVTVNPLPAVNAGPDQTICAGSPVVLSGSGANTYSWNNGVTNNVAFNPAATLTYTVTGTDANLCTNTDQVLVTVNPLPIINAGPDQTICIGASATLTGTGAGVGGVYAWNNGVTNGVAFNPAVTTTYTVTGTDANLCANTDQVIVNVNPLDDPSFNYPLGLTYCETAANPTPNVTGVTGGTFSYSVTSGGPTLDLNTSTGTINLANSDVGTYSITYNTAGAPGSLCPQSTSLNLSITSAPIADFTFGVYCANAIDPSPTFINGGSGGVFSAAPAGLTINSATGVVDVSASTAGTYTVTNTINISGCALVSATDDITVNELPTANITGTTTICPEAPLPDVTINITAGAPSWDLTYTYNGAPTTVNVATSPYIITGAAVGTYTLSSITDANGCSNTLSGSAIISNFPTPVMDAFNDQDVCEGSNLAMNAFGSNITGSTFSWTNTTGVNVGFGLSGNGFIPTFLATNGTGTDIAVTVSVIPTSPNGCVGLAENFIVNVHPLPTVSFTGGPLNGCAPLTVTFTNTSMPVGSNCLWTFGNGNSGYSCDSITNIYEAGLYSVSLAVTTSFGCYATTTYTDYVNVSPLPIASFSFAPQIIDIDDTEVEFTNHSDYADSYEWDFGDNSTVSNLIHPTHIFPQVPDDFLVTLIATNNGGLCADTAQQVITIQDVLIFYVPNVFTPDHDDFNEVFQPVFTSGFDPFDFHLMIFNRWGEVIFESYDATKGWDGTYSDQGLVQDDVYIWQIEFKETMSDKRHTHRGHVTVLK